MQLKLIKLFLTTLIFFLFTVFNIVIASAGTQYTYDANGNRLTMTDNTGITSYRYNALNQLIRLTNPSKQAIAFTYDAAGRRAGMTYPNGMTAKYTYDAANRLTALSYHLGNSTIASFSYTYDVMDNCTSMTDEYGTHTYTYDNLYRLTQATHPQSYNPTESYTYDTVGNRNPTTNVYNEANQLTHDSDYVYLYNMNGNTVYRRDKNNLNRLTYYYWNVENQLSKIEEYSSLASNIITSVSKYIYDGEGRRVAKNVNNAITKYVYDEDDIILETDNNDKILARYTHGPAIDEPLIMQRDTNGDGTVDTAYYYIADGLGSIVKLVNSSGSVVNNYVYDSFGNMVSKTEGVSNRYTYTGREYDAESGLYYYRIRYYNAKIARFLREDPLDISSILLLKQYPEYKPVAYSLYAYELVNPALLNRYVYVGNSPIEYTDPYGLLTIPGVGWIDFGEKYAIYALKYYANIIVDPYAAWYEKAGAHTGAFFSALWTPCASDKTLRTLITAYSLSKAFRFDSPHHGLGPHDHFYKWRMGPKIPGWGAKGSGWEGWIDWIIQGGGWQWP